MSMHKALFLRASAVLVISLAFASTTQAQSIWITDPTNPPVPNWLALSKKSVTVKVTPKVTGDTTRTIKITFIRSFDGFEGDSQTILWQDDGDHTPIQVFNGMNVSSYNSNPMLNAWQIHAQMLDRNGLPSGQSGPDVQFNVVQ